MMKQSIASLFKTRRLREMTPIEVLQAISRNSSVAVNLTELEAQADQAVAEGRAERAAEYAARIHEYAAAVRECLQPGEHGAVPLGKAERAVFAAMHLARTSQQLLADIHFAGAVQEKARRRHNASALSDADIQAAINEYPTRKAAAEALGIDPRQLRRRMAARSVRTS